VAIASIPKPSLQLSPGEQSMLSPGPGQADRDVSCSGGSAAERRGRRLGPLPAPDGAAVAGREEGLLRDRHRRYGLRVHSALAQRCHVVMLPAYHA